MDFKTNLKYFIKTFLVPFIIFVVVMIIAIPSSIAQNKKYKDFVDNGGFGPSTNTSRVYGSQRVFDYADKLTSEEEAYLEELISVREKYAGNDIVIVTLNESLADYEPAYRDKYSMKITPELYVMVYADKFWEDNKFGYNCPQKLDGLTETGDGVLLVDNNFREPETGRIYTWMCTTGDAEEKYSSEMINEALDVFYEKVDTDYFQACVDFVNKVTYDLEPEYVKTGKVKFKISLCPAILAGIIAFFYASAKMSQKTGKDTTDKYTYMDDRGVSYSTHEDKYTGKSTTKSYSPISTSSSSGHSGGGGHHFSGGGGSHGGGGHSR